MPPEKRRDISIVGDQASLYCDFQKNALLLYQNRHEKQGDRWVALEGEINEIPLESKEPLHLELKAFLDSMRSRSNPLADGDAGYEALKIVEACYASSQSGGSIKMDWGKF
jgi:predicted dehydrogenase